MQSALSVYMGSEAANTIGERGWQAAPFSTLIGASGGPKVAHPLRARQGAGSKGIVAGARRTDDVVGVFDRHLAPRLPESQ